MTTGLQDKGNQAGTRLCSRCGHELARKGTAPRSREIRKRVTVLFADISQSTALTERLDPEIADMVGERFRHVAKRTLERYGATVEVGGDEAKAIFGVPRLHEDDAVHAVWAATMLNDALAGLNEELERHHQVRLNLHTGVHTGEIVSVEGAAAESSKALSLTISVSHRFMEVARPNDIVMSSTTYELVRHVVEAEHLPPQQLKGLQDPASAWRLLSINPDVVIEPQRPPLPLIGRAPELDILRAGYARAVSRRIWRVVRVLGDAGVGRSSLVEGFIKTLSEDPGLTPSPLVLWGRCLSYLSGVQASPISQMVRQAAGIQRDNTTDEALKRLLKLLRHDELLATRVAPLLGLPGSPGGPQETWHALRRLFELLAHRQPLILVVDDLHAAPVTVLQTLEDLAASPPGATVLLICTIRSESLEDLNAWGARLPEVESFRTPELTSDESHQLIMRLLPGPPFDLAMVEWVARRAHGNPLQIKELIASMSENSPPAALRMSPTGVDNLNEPRPAANVEAVLAARLDGLPSAEQTVVEAAAVIDAPFTVVEIGPLCPAMESEAVAGAVRALERKELIVSDAGQERYALRVRYRNVACRRLTKERRLELHIAYANWLENELEERDEPELDAKIGSHLDAAYQYRVELHPQEQVTADLARRAGEHLAAAGHSQLTRLFPDPSTARLLERATGLLPRHFPSWRRATLDLANLLQEEQPERALVLYDQVLETAGAIGDRSIEHQATLGRMEVIWFRSFEGDWNEGCDEVSRLLQEIADPLSRAKAWRLLAHAHAAAGRAEDAVKAVKEASRIVRQANDPRLEAKILELASVVLFWGPTPLDDVVTETRRFAAWAEEHGLYDLQASALSILSRATAMQGDIGRAQELLHQARSIRPARKDLLTIGTDSISNALVEMLAGELEAAERTLLESYESLRQRNARVAFASVAVMLARVRLQLGRTEEAARTALEAKEAAVESHFDAQIKWRSLLALVRARRGEQEAAEQLARQAVALADKSGQPDTRAQALLDLAEVLEAGGNSQKAAEAARRALGIYEWRGSPILAERVREVLARLRAV
jgi:class 3 adenylate cyclase/tetratricopeptide (TPR) repeat protein